jgi:hypothetical protein
VVDDPVSIPRLLDFMKAAGCPFSRMLYHTCPDHVEIDINEAPQGSSLPLTHTALLRWNTGEIPGIRGIPGTGY